MQSLCELLDRRIRERVEHALHKSVGPLQWHHRAVLEAEVRRAQEVVCALLLRALDGSAEEPPASPKEPQQSDEKLPATDEILERAEKLQVLAMSSSSEHERSAAWLAFQKLWQRYSIPVTLGLKKEPA